MVMAGRFDHTARGRRVRTTRIRDYADPDHAVRSRPMRHRPVD